MFMNIIKNSWNIFKL